MYKILNLMATDDGCGYYRNFLPSRHCREQLAAEGILIDVKPAVDNELYDCYIFSRVPNPRSFAIVSKLYMSGCKIVWDLDDEVWNISKSNKSSYEYYDNTMICFLSMYLEISSFISVSTQNLKDSLMNRFRIPGDRVHVLENLVSIGEYPLFPRTDCVKVIFSGSDSHASDLEEIDAGLQYIVNKRLPIIFYGYIPNKYKQNNERNLNIIHIPFHDKCYYERTLSVLSPEIALIPLENTQFNSCKSAIKYFEMSMAGAACVVSGSGTYPMVEHGVNGMVYDNADEFISCCEGLIASRPLREQLNQYAKRIIIDEYSWNTDNRRVRAWLDFFRSLAVK